MSNQSFPPTLVLDEVFEYFPKSLELYGTVAGEYPVYSNDTIVKTTLDWMSKSNSTKQIMGPIKAGIEKRIIMIGFTNPSVFSFIKRRLTKNVSKFAKNWIDFDIFGIGIGSVLGLYAKSDGRIAILLDPSVDIFGRSITSIPSTLTHELCHKISHDKTKEYLHLMMKPLLYPFFKKFWFSLDSRTYGHKMEKLIDAIVTVTVRVEGSTSRTLMRDVVWAWFRFLESCGIKKEDVEIDVQKALLPIFLLVWEEDFDADPELVKKVWDWASYFNEAYDFIGVDAGHSVVGQEIVFTSEILCIANQNEPSPQAIQLINKLSF